MERVRETLTIDQIRSCLTVRDLANLLVYQAERDQTARVQLSPEVGSTESGQPEGCEYPVWFGTNRRPSRSASMLSFSNTRDTVIHYGVCRVFIPKSHKIGSLGSPWWKRVLAGQDDRLSMLSITELNVDEYWSMMRQSLEDVDVDDRDAVIFIHGYNVSFLDAALRTAQLGFDLSVRGAMAFFSWPSQGATLSYSADEATIEASETLITEFIGDIATRSQARAVHIIAHSMGNRALLRAVTRIAAAAEHASKVHFGQIILAAPDVDAGVFRQLCEAYGQVSSRTTLYVSAKDRAVEASGWLHQFARVGLTPPICVVSGIDTVNVTNVDLTMLGHGYVAEARDILQDMHDLLTHGTEPSRRFGLRQGITESGEVFWIVGA